MSPSPPDLTFQFLSMQRLKGGGGFGWGRGAGQPLKLGSCGEPRLMLANHVIWWLQIWEFLVDKDLSGKQDIKCYVGTSYVCTLCVFDGEDLIVAPCSQLAARYQVMDAGSKWGTFIKAAGSGSA